MKTVVCRSPSCGYTSRQAGLQGGRQVEKQKKRKGNGGDVAEREADSE